MAGGTGAGAPAVGGFVSALGSKEERIYDWALLPWAEHDGWEHALLVRRSLEAKPEYAFYFTYARKPQSTLQALVAGWRWAVESAFQMAKGECGLDHYEVRHWQGWYRHIILSMPALAVLTRVARRREKEPLRTGFRSACRRSGICSLPCCAAAVRGCNTCCTALTGVGGASFLPSSSTTESNTSCSLLLSYCCSTNINRGRRHRASYPDFQNG